jgi:hypothetical protein
VVGVSLRVKVVKAVEAESATQQGLGDVAHPHAAAGDAAFGPGMRVSVDGEVGSALVDRLREQVAAEERIDLGGFAGHRVGDRRVVCQGNANVATRAALLVCALRLGRDRRIGPCAPYAASSRHPSMPRSSQ